MRLRREGRRARLLYVVPNFQNPTGLLIGLEKRAALLEWAERRDVLIVEDDPYRELYFEDSATEADVRPIARRRSLGPRHLLEQLLEDAGAGLSRGMDRRAAAGRGQARDGEAGGGPLHRRARPAIVYEACRRGILDRQAPILRAHYQHKRDVMVAALRRELGSDRDVARSARRVLSVGDAAADVIDADAMIARAVEHGVVYVAGEAFFVDGSGQRLLRLSFSAPTPSRIDEGVARLAAAVREELAASRSESPVPAAP